MALLNAERREIGIVLSYTQQLLATTEHSAASLQIYLQHAAFHHDLLALRLDAGQREELGLEEHCGLCEIELDVVEALARPFDVDRGHGDVVAVWRFKWRAGGKQVASRGHASVVWEGVRRQEQWSQNNLLEKKRPS